MIIEPWGKIYDVAYDFLIYRSRYQEPNVSKIVWKNENADTESQ